jgi:hypothetical protein
VKTEAREWGEGSERRGNVKTDRTESNGHGEPSAILADYDATVREEMQHERRSSWSAVDLRPHLEDPNEDDAPDLLATSDGSALLYRGRRNEIHGPPESGKSFLAGLVALEVIRGGQTVVWLDFEDSPRSVAGRMLALGATPADLLDRFRYVAPSERLTSAAEIDLRQELHGSSLVVVDAANEAMALAGLDPNHNRDVAAWYATAPRLALDAGSTPLTLDHVAKDPGAQRGAVGAGHKIAAVDTSYRLDVVTPFGRGSIGRVRLRLKKDRPGYVRGRLGTAREPIAAEIVFDATDPTAIGVDVRAPSVNTGAWRPTGLMEGVSRYLEDLGEPASGRKIREHVAGKSVYVGVAIDELVRGGFVATADGPRGATLHVSVRPFREEEI